MFNMDNTSRWRLFFPPAQWLAGYQSIWLGSDALAGFTLAAYAIPVSLAYAALAGRLPNVLTGTANITNKEESVGKPATTQ